MFAQLFPRFVRRVLMLQIAVVMASVGVEYGVSTWLISRELTAQYGDSALRIARAVAAAPGIGDTVAAGDPEREVQELAESIRRSTRVLSVVVTDRNGIRLAHPDPDRIGRPVSTNPQVALSGSEVTGLVTGTLGPSVRAKVPVRDHTGVVVGMVSVGFAVTDLTNRTREISLLIGGCTALILVFGVLASTAIGYRLKRQTLGLDSDEFPDLVRKREVVMHGLEEGVLAVDSAGRITVCNARAASLLGISVRIGTPLDELDISPRLRGMLEDHRDGEDQLLIVGQRMLVLHGRKVVHDEQNLGFAITIRDRTDLVRLTRELEAVRSLQDTLRAHRHETANRLHTVSGMLQLGHYDDAENYLRQLAIAVTEPDVPEHLSDPFLSAFLAAKSALAREKGVDLTVDASTVDMRMTVDPVDITTVVGNLIDNAIEAARQDPRGWVDIELLAEDTDLVAIVADSGGGIPADLTDRVFEDGFSTRGEMHGLGLALARHVARNRSGDVTLLDRGGGPAHGAIFLCRLPGALTGTNEEVSPA
ncbi:sensor histidine kinase [Nocardia sp. CDC160]|uniref:sensor histidine kinase n=1 Tax=Nocardia sp. CDC160 TaxID=3112166 RepID=UPI002DBB10E5|nr:sensor histidine kinase [Nocardia sp. CDC160]MEC3914806.1 sensor histidine kinase [Nocardia sp. CDC160]